MNAAGGILWGYAAQWGMAKDFPRLLLLGIISGVVLGTMATPIVVFVFGGATGVPTDLITASLLSAGYSLFSAAYIATLASNLADKIISVFVATAIVTALPPVLKSNVQVAQYRGFKAVGYAVTGIVIGIIIMALIMVHVL
ncbi:MAG: hypothetical protein ACP5GH_05850 [Nitrososphaeria archaeon]